MAEQEKMLSNKEARHRLQKRLKEKKGDRDLMNFGSSQPNDESLFLTAEDYKQFSLIAPPYPPEKMYRIVESSSMLGTCIESYVQNIDGYGHEFSYLGDKQEEESEEVASEREALKGFFEQVNEDQSMTDLRKALRRDYEITGNAYIEVVRYRDESISTIYRADSKYMHLQAKQKDAYPIKVPLKRNGRIRNTTVYKYFRRFAMVIAPYQTGTGSTKLRWFKEFGDPRRMDAKTGKYENELGKGEKIEEEANEIIHWKQGNDTYGVPRWAGMASVVLGINNADYVNYDLFNSNAIPALAVLVSGGQLTAESVDDLAEVLAGGKGVENWHRVAILETTGENAENIGDKPTSSSVDFKELNKPSDSEFNTYIDQSEKRIRSKFRLPPLMTGSTEEYSRASAESSKLIAEEQVFTPERDSFDEMINFRLMPALGTTYFKFVTTGPKMMDSDEQIDALGKLSRAGALSINDEVRIANRVLDLDMAPYNEDWAKIPVPILLEMVKNGQISEINGVGNPIPTNKETKEAKSNSRYTIDDLASTIEELDDKMERINDLLAKME